MLSRLIYASEPAAPLHPTAVQSLLDQARVANHGLDITGLLVFDRRYFLQAIEGSRRAISGLLQRLARDPRHRDIVLLSFEPITQRLFSDWSMGFVGADAANRALFLRHGDSRQFDPYGLTGPAALALLQELSAQSAGQAGTARSA